MRNFKPSKFLIFSSCVAAIFAAIVTGNADAASSTQYNRSVRDMMARRHNASTKTWFGAKKKTVAPSASYTRTISNKRSTTAQSGSSYHTAPATTLSLAEWFNPSDKDGSLFPGGPCKNCHNSGPLIKTGSCDRCYDNGPLIDTGPCKKCKEPKPEPLPEPACPVCEEPQLANYTISYNDYIVQAVVLHIQGMPARATVPV